MEFLYKPISVLCEIPDVHIFCIYCLPQSYFSSSFSFFFAKNAFSHCSDKPSNIFVVYWYYKLYFSRLLICNHSTKIHRNLYIRFSHVCRQLNVMELSSCNVCVWCILSKFYVLTFKMLIMAREIMSFQVKQWEFDIDTLLEDSTESIKSPKPACVFILPIGKTGPLFMFHMCEMEELCSFHTTYICYGSEHIHEFDAINSIIYHIVHFNINVLHSTENASL